MPFGAQIPHLSRRRKWIVLLTEHKVIFGSDNRTGRMYYDTGALHLEGARDDVPGRWNSLYFWGQRLKSAVGCTANVFQPIYSPFSGTKTCSV